MVVAALRCEQKSGFGIDLLLDPARVEPELEYLIALPGELNVLAAVALHISPLALAFSIKESVVKAVSPGINDYLDFRDIELCISGRDIQARVAKYGLALRCEFVSLESGLLSAAILMD